MRVFFWLTILSVSATLGTQTENDDNTAKYIHLISDFFQRDDKGTDIPLLNGIPPSTSFSCEDKIPGYYADLEHQCQIFHLCTPGGERHAFLCANGTTFNQEVMTCDWWFRSTCDQAPQFFHLNENLYRVQSESDTLEDDLSMQVAREKSGRQLVDPVLSLFISADPSSSRRGKSLASQAFDTEETIQNEQYANSPDTDRDYRYDANIPFDFNSQRRVNSLLQNEENFSPNIAHVQLKQDSGYLPPEDEPVQPLDGYLPPEDEPVQPLDGYLPPEDEPVQPLDGYLPPEDEPVQPLDGYLPPEDEPVQPLDGYLPPEDEPVQPLDGYLPPEDEPVQPLDGYLPPEDEPVQPLDGYFPPEDEPVQPLDGYLPPENEPVHRLDVLRGYLPPEDDPIPDNSHLPPSYNDGSIQSRPDPALVGFSFQVPKQDFINNQ